MGVYEGREDEEGADHILAFSHKRKEGWCGKREEKKVNQKSKPKKKSQAVFLFAHDTSSAESHAEFLALVMCADHRRPSSCTDRTMLAPPHPSAQCRTA